MISPGDIDPPSGVLWTTTRTLRVTYTWYPVVGNHELLMGGCVDGCLQGVIRYSQWGMVASWSSSSHYEQSKTNQSRGPAFGRAR